MACTTQVVKFKLRRGTAAEWRLPGPCGPTLLAGEPGYETDTNKLKIGDGVTAWCELPYLAPGVSPSPASVFDGGDACTNPVPYVVGVPVIDFGRGCG
jgi:hypothetical protein